LPVDDPARGPYQELAGLEDFSAPVVAQAFHQAHRLYLNDGARFGQ
jgi:hypothetical protein